MKIAIAGPVNLVDLSRFVPQDLSLNPSKGAPLLGDLANAYIDAGHSISIFTFQADFQVKERFFGSWGPVELTILPCRRPRRAIFDLFKAESVEMAQEISRSGAEVVHGHWTSEWGLAAAWSSMPHLVTVHDLPKVAFKYLQPRWFWTARYVLSEKVFRSVKTIAANSPYTAQYCRSHAPQAVIHTIPNAVSKELFDLPRTRVRNTGEPLIIAAATDGFSELKNGKNLLKAFARVLATEPNSRLLLFGVAHGSGQEAHRWAIAQGLEKNVEFVGSVPRSEMLSRLASQADLLVHPSLEESFGMVVAESMALGVPVVGGERSGAVPWLLGQGEFGTLCDVRDVESLSEGILAAGKAAAIQKSSLARTRMAREFQLDDMASKYLKLLEALGTRA